MCANGSVNFVLCVRSDSHIPGEARHSFANSISSQVLQLVSSPQRQMKNRFSKMPERCISTMPLDPLNLRIGTKSRSMAFGHHAKRVYETVGWETKKEELVKVCTGEFITQKNTGQHKRQWQCQSAPCMWQRQTKRKQCRSQQHKNATHRKLG